MIPVQTVTHEFWAGVFLGVVGTLALLVCLVVIAVGLSHDEGEVQPRKDGHE